MGKLIESWGFKWYLDDGLPDNFLAVYDHSRYLNVNGKIITMYPKDEVVIKIKKVD